MKVLVLGAGNAGKAIVWDLRREFDVYVGDISGGRLKAVSDFTTPVKVNASRFDKLVETMRDFELITGALPGRFGYSSVKTTIKAGVDMVDVSFMPENPFELRGEAENAGVTAIVGAGFASGLSPILMGRIWNELDDMSEGYIYVGGLPKEPRPPLYYRLTLSPKDLIEEYTRPARLIRNGKVHSVDPLSESKRVAIEGLFFEAFLSDGLRSLLESVRFAKLEEWTQRWLGHLDKMKVLGELGFFRQEHMDKTLEVMTPLMTYDSPDFSIMKVIGREPEILGMRVDTFKRILDELEKREIRPRREENASLDDS